MRGVNNGRRKFEGFRTSKFPIILKEKEMMVEDTQSLTKKRTEEIIDSIKMMEEENEEEVTTKEFDQNFSESVMLIREMKESGALKSLGF